MVGDNEKQDDKLWDIPQILEAKIESARNYFSNVINEPDLGRAFAALYMAEAAPEGCAALKQTSYAAAELGLEGYIADVSHRANQEGKDGLTAGEAARVLDFCRELSDYCRNQAGYFSQDAPKENGHTKA